MPPKDSSGVASPYCQNVATKFGFVISIMMDADCGDIDIRSLYAWCQVPIRIGNIVFVFDDTGSPKAFATWAYLSRPTADRLRSGESDLLHHEDWNDGDDLWIVDFFAPHGDVRRLVSVLIDRLGSTFSEVSYCRRRRSGVGRCHKLALGRRHRTSAP